jgi:hypothetical protein
MKRLVACVLLVPVLVTGCATNPHCHGGALVVEYKPGDEPTMSRAPYKADYALYRWPTAPEGPPPHTWRPDHDAVELYVRGLKKWDQLGFEKVDGGIVAVAGTEKIHLEPGQYCWHVTSDTEYSGLRLVLHETGEGVVYIVSLPFALAMWVVLMPVVLVVGSLAVLG